MDLSSMDGSRKKTSFNVHDVSLIALFAAVLFIQEELLTFIPNVQLTIFLLILYSKKFGFLKTSIITIIYVVLDNLVMGSFNVIYFPTMLIGWMIIPIVTCTLLRKIDSPFILAIAGGVFAFTYSWTFILPNYIVYHIDPIVYLVSDLLFEGILAACGFISTLILYKPCSKFFDKTDELNKIL